ncbi:MAG: hypothetical protein ACI4S2_10895 [Lachnospiraceae bacterium]
MRRADDLLNELADICGAMYISDLRNEPFCGIAEQILRSSIVDLSEYRAEDINEVKKYFSCKEKKNRRGGLIKCQITG